MLGMNDRVDSQTAQPMMPMPGFDRMFSGIMGNMMKMIEKEMNQIDRGERKEKSQAQPKMNPNFQLFINGRKVNIPGMNIQMQGSGNNPQVRQKQSNKLPAPSAEVLKHSAKLPRKEAQTKLTRMDNKVVYEVEAPGVAGFDRVLINKLEDSYEVKTFGEEKVFFKNIPIKLPLMQAYLRDDRLFLEFQNLSL